MLKLSNFEKQVNGTILSSAKKYYQDGKIIDLEKSNDNFWRAEVTGTETYSVEVTLGKNNAISDYSCNCPYDGGTCKHVVAVFFAIRDEIKNAPTVKTKTSQKLVFDDLVKKIGLKELQQFIVSYAVKSKDFKTDFELYFADKDERIDVSKKYGDLIKKIIRKHSDADWGVISYRSAYSLSRDMDKLIATGHDLVNKNNFKDAFLLVKPVLKEMVEVIPESDDSNGDIGDTIQNAIRLLQNISEAGQVANELKEQVFNFLQSELGNAIYFDYGDYGYELFAVFQNLAVALGKSEQFLKFIDDRVASLTGAYTDYRKDFFRTQKIDFLKATGNSKEAEALIHQNMDIVEVRLLEVNKAINRKDFVKAKMLIAEGIKVAEQKKHPGTVADWQKELLRIAVLEKDKSTIRYYTKHFAFDRWFNELYYKQWKQTFSATEWKDAIEKHIEGTIAAITKEYEKGKKKMWNPPANPPLLREIAPIYIQEKYWDRLLALVQKEADMHTTLEYHKYLFKEYPGELIEIYLPAFECKADRCNSRSEYAELAGKMKMVIKDIPAAKSKIIALAKKLKQKYPRRPAMIEELDKII